MWFWKKPLLLSEKWIRGIWSGSNHLAIDEVKKLAQQISPAISPDNFKWGL
jgi:hypothetical protein